MQPKLVRLQQSVWVVYLNPAFLNLGLHLSRLPSLTTPVRFPDQSCTNLGNVPWSIHVNEFPSRNETVCSFCRDPQRIQSYCKQRKKSNRSSANPVTSFLSDANAELLETDLVSLWSGVWMRRGLGIPAGLMVFYFWVWDLVTLGCAL